MFSEWLNVIKSNVKMGKTGAMIACDLNEGVSDVNGLQLNYKEVIDVNNDSINLKMPKVQINQNVNDSYVGELDKSVQLNGFPEI